jgi:DNA-directed RNA polymerase subunit M/transcription elongation factor TFIIS
MKFNLPHKDEFKRVFFDIETSQALVFTWRTGYKLSIQADRIYIPAKVICISWKWEGYDEVYHLHWDMENGCDKDMLKQFVETMDFADEIVAHNGDKFDMPWLTGRMVIHEIPALPDYKTVDTCKMARKHKFPSNRLDDLGEYFGLGKKIRHRGIVMWDEIQKATFPWATKEEKDLGAKALPEMLDYCDQDVRLLEAVYHRLAQYAKAKTHVGVHLGGEKWECAKCGSDHVIRHGVRTTAKGSRNQRMKCMQCGHNYQISTKSWADYYEQKNRKDGNV